jgi:hypothetical protein
MTRTLIAFAITVNVLQSVYALAADEPFIGPLARAAIHQAAVEGGASHAESPANRGDRLSDWSHVENLKPGTSIILDTATLVRASCFLLRADGSGLVVLNVSDASIPDSVRNTLLEAAIVHPNYFLEARDGASFRLDPTVRRHAAVPLQLSQTGVALGDRRLADLDQIVENVARRDVEELRTPKKHFWQHVRRGAAIGAIGGALIGGYAAATCVPGSEYCDVAPMALAGAILGAGIGVEYGTLIGAVAPKSPELIYRVARPK